ncbi:unnamed protein product [Rotaria sp. Silwood1]|nr:unnamed protein product [Rotaria sp. Silwood1]
MSITQNRTNTDTKQTPNNVPPYYPHPQYGYGSLSSYYPGSTDPYMYSSPPYYNTEYNNYPVNEYGQPTAAPTYFPPIVNQNQPEYNTYPTYGPNGSIDGSYMYPPRNDHMYYPDYYYPNYYPGYETARRETLPPIHQQRPNSIQPALPAEDEYEVLRVTDLTYRASSPSRSTGRDTEQKTSRHSKRKKIHE